MKYVFVLISVSLGLFFLSCKSSKKATDPMQNLSEGTVSHQYRAGGCKTVIKVAQPEADTLVLIPSNSLGKFDVDGLKIMFSYRQLRMPNPEGCTVGMPAEITSIKKK